MRNLKIGKKLLVGFGVVLLMTVVLGVVGVSVLLSVDTGYSAGLDSIVKPLPILLDIVDDVQIVRIYARNLIIYDSGTDLYKENVNSYNEAQGRINENLQKYLDMLDKNGATYETFAAVRENYVTNVRSTYDQVVALTEKNDADGAATMLRDNAAMLGGFKDSILSQFETKLQDLDKLSIENTKTSNSMVLIMIIISVVAAAVGVVMALILSKGITKPLAEMLNAAQAISVGDIEAKVSYKSKDEIGQLAVAFDHMINGIRAQADTIKSLADGDLTIDIEKRSDKDVMNVSLHTLIETNNSVFSEIRHSSESVMSGSKQVSDASQTLATGSTEQASAVQQLKEAISEVSTQTQENAKRAEKASDLGGQIQNLAQQGNDQMKEMITAVNEINQSSDEISKVIKVIDDIAFQTNILALNAAVEAARAGQHGKGFAVVAEEVRNLASKSAEAAKNTGILIENSREKAQHGAVIANETADSLSRIVENINTNTQLVSEISQLSDDQSKKIGEINISIGQVADVVQANSATSQESAAASEELASQSEVLGGLIERFRLKNDAPALKGNKPLRIASRTADRIEVLDDDGFGKY